MLLPDEKTPLESSIYFNGGVLIKELRKENKQHLFDLFERTKDANGMSFSTFILSLDWLYLVDLVKMNDEGCLELCS